MTVTLELNGVRITITTDSFKLEVKDDVDVESTVSTLRQDAAELNKGSADVKKALEDVQK